MKTRLSLIAAASLLAAANGASAATVAGTQITNQASATYTDTTGTKTVQSNVVVTTVQQVASLPEQRHQQERRRRRHGELLAHRHQHR